MSKKRSTSPKMSASNVLATGESNVSLEIDSSHSQHSSHDYLIRNRQKLPEIVRRPPPPKTTFAAGVLLIMGVVFLIIGLTMYLTGNKNTRSQQGLPLIILGAISK